MFTLQARSKLSVTHYYALEGIGMHCQMCYHGKSSSDAYPHPDSQSQCMCTSTVSRNHSARSSQAESHDPSSLDSLSLAYPAPRGRSSYSWKAAASLAFARGGRLASGQGGPLL